MSEPTARSPRPWLRRLLLIAGPVVAGSIALVLWLHSGRYAATDNAYIRGDTALISSEVTGPITRVAVTENQRVQRGTVLFEVDDAPYRLKVERAESQLAEVRALIRSLAASYDQQLAQLELAGIDLGYYQREYDRQLALNRQEAGTESDLDKARYDYEAAQKEIPIIEQSLARLRAQVGDGIVGALDDAGDVVNPQALFEGNGAYRTVRAMLDDAKLELEHTLVRAPFDGIVTGVPVAGQVVATGSPVMAMVDDRQLWVEANFKETQLTHVAPGQPVSIRVDTYPDRKWQGVVDTISPVTGSEFSVIPAQNASGNWVKVAQRIPVRIRLERNPDDPQLRIGMSTVVKVDTGYTRSETGLSGLVSRSD